MWQVRRPILQLLIVGAVVHACLLAAVHVRTGRIDGYAFNSLDCNEYYAIARNLAERGCFTQSGRVGTAHQPDAPRTGVVGNAHPTVGVTGHSWRQVSPDSTCPAPDTWRTPGYPLALAIFMLLVDESPALLVIVQQLLSVLNVCLLFLIARRWMSDRRAFIVALVFLLEPYHLYYSLWLMSTTLFVTVLLLMWLVWQRALQTKAWGWFALLGALSGYLVLVRPVASIVPIVVFAGLAAWTAFLKSLDRESLLGPPEDAEKGLSAEHARNRAPTSEDVGHPARKSLWAALPAFAIACMVVVGSWMIRNQAVAGHFALSDQGGVVLAYFKATEVVLWREGRVVDRYLETTLDPAKAALPHTVWDKIDARLQSRFPSLPDDERAALQWRNLAQGNRTTADSFAVSQALSEIGWSYLLSSPVTTAVCCLVRCGSILIFPLNLALKPPTGVDVHRIESAVKSGVYLLLCVGVLARLLRGRLRFEQLYYPLACTLALLVATTPQVDPRFRVPMIPLLLLVALLPRPATE